MGLHMLGEMIAPHKPFPTLLTAEALLPGVRAEMPLQLIGACEALPAEEPVADEGTLAGVPAQVRLQVRGFFVNLATVWNVTNVESFFPEL